MILIIDIDETLIHSTKNTPSSSVLRDNNINATDVFTVFNYSVQKRPYLDLFLSKVLNDDYYEVGVWSAGTHDYVHAIINNIIPDQSRLKFVLTSDDCNEKRDKPLAKVRDLVAQIDRRKDIPYDRTVHDFLIIDDRDKVTGHDELNHLQILEYEGDELDTELRRLWEYLDKYRYHSSEYLATHWR